MFIHMKYCRFMMGGGGVLRVGVEGGVEGGLCPQQRDLEGWK